MDSSGGDGGATVENSGGREEWKLHMKEFQQPRQTHHDNNNHQLSFPFRLRKHRKQRKVAEYYKKQERLLEDFTEMETMTETGFLPGTLTEDEMKQLAKSERMAVYVSNACNLVLFGAKVFASIESRSLAVIASTLDSLLDLLSGFILWFTAHAMKTPNQYYYPIGKNRMQPVSDPEVDPVKLNWMIGIMVFVTVVKFILMVYCRRFKNEIIRAYAQDHLFDVVTNSVGLAAAVLAIALYTINTWTRTVIENVSSLIGRTAPPDYLAKLTYLIWNHHKQIKHIDTVRAYTFGAYYFVEVDIVLPEDMLVNEAHNIGETLQVKLEQLPEVERAFVHIDFEFTHRPEHKTMV
ncbi:unnamed protein product [Lupinus luteus]|uniref:Cation efflux protein cytoplasmic domain-containing protein n=1 Tax=Lupinus luteus TaxID=3873 RepID=A0AAV1WNZ0_LUPLU